MKRIIAFSAWLVLLGVLAPVPECRADGLIIVDEVHWLPGPRPPHPIPPPWPPRPLPPAPRPYAPLEVVYHHVNVKIDGQIATTAVDQEFYNPNPQQLFGSMGKMRTLNTSRSAYSSSAGSLSFRTMSS